MRNVLESTTIIDDYPAVIDRYFKHRHSIHKGPFHIYIYIMYIICFSLFQPKNLQNWYHLVPHESVQQRVPFQVPTPRPPGTLGSSN